MTTKKPRRWQPEFSDDIQGARRREIIEEHLQWQERRQHEKPRDLSQYPLAQWLAKHRARLAQARSETLAQAYRNTKLPRSRPPR